MEDLQNAMRMNESDGTRREITSAAKRARRVLTAQTRTPRVRHEPSIVHPDDEQIRLRAYEIYLRRDGAPGEPFDDWLLAERELSAETPVPKKLSSASRGRS